MNLILYINGDSNAAGAELVNDYAFADDDPKYSHLGRRPHPDNIPMTYGYKLSKIMNTGFMCDAESASSNDRIMRTTVEFLNTGPDNPFILIGWSTWEREEWELDGKLYQITASGTDNVPDEFKAQYRQWVANQTPDEILNKKLNWQNKIFDLHQQLKTERIKHLFFNSFSSLDQDNKEWGQNYFHPYEEHHTFYNYLKNSRHTPTLNYHHGVPAHQEWAQVLFDKIRLMM